MDTIKSVNSQTYEDIEHVFIDGLSSDNTLDLIKQNSKKNNIVISEKDNGIYHAFNKGISYASGEIIGFLHSDDLFFSSKVVFNIVNEIKNKGFDGVYGDLQYVKKNSTSRIVRYWRSNEFNIKLLDKGWMPAHPTLFLKKEVYAKHGTFNQSFKISADYEFMLRILKDHELNFGYLSKVFTKMRIGGASNRSLLNILKKISEDYRALRLNDIGGVFTIILKNFNKVPQFFLKNNSKNK